MFRRLVYKIAFGAVWFVAAVLWWLHAYADPIITGAIPNTFTPGTTISSSQMNANFQYIINQANANAAKNGANSSITALTGLTTPIVPAEGGSNVFIGGLSAGTANAQTIGGTTPTGYTIAYGNSVRFIAGLTNTGATTLAVAGTAITNVYKQTPAGLSPLTGGEIAAGNEVEVFYDGAQYEVKNPPNLNGGFGFLSSLAGSAAPDLGTVPSHNVNLSGGPFTITSFGSSASVTYPYYMVRFNAANILTNSASLILLGSMQYRTTAASDEGLYFYNGAGVWYELAYFPNSVRYAPSMANQLFIRNGVTPNTKIDVSAKEVVMDNAAGANQYVDSYFGGATCTIDLTINGSGGLDTGVLAANTWYYIYLTGDGGAGSNCIASASATAPTLPAGTPYKMRAGAIRTATAAATLWSFVQRGNRTMIATTDNQIGGNAGTCTTTPVFAATTQIYGLQAPSTATHAIMQLQDTSTGGGQMCLTAFNSTTDAVCAGGYSSAVAALKHVQMIFANTGSNVLYYCGAAISNGYATVGWIDAVNAN